MCTTDQFDSGIFVVDYSFKMSQVKIKVATRVTDTTVVFYPHTLI